jgi:Fe-S cluster biogenesis protein NfuA
MFIQTESTPNPDMLKFLPGCEVLAGESRHFMKGSSSLAQSPLAEALCAIPGIKSVFLGADFITIGKEKSADWKVLKAQLLTAVMEHFVTGKPVLLEQVPQKAEDSKDSPLVKEVKTLLDTKIRPAVAQDGGDIIFRDFDEATGILTLEMHGACSGCPSSAVTLKDGVERLLQHYVPEIKEVRAVA